MDQNPFEAPSTDSLIDPAPPSRSYLLADPGKRFLARLVDNLIVWIFPIVVVFAAPSPEEVGALFWAAMAPVALIQAILISTRGQSIGKMLLKTKIVDMQHGEAGFLRGVLLREWLAIVLGFIPLFSLIDALFVFRADHRTVHDLIGGTQVVDLSVRLD